MKIALILAVVAYVAAIVTPALAACPSGTSYQCTQGYNGKVICGCR